jgi:hypothetical protein
VPSPPGQDEHHLLPDLPLAKPALRLPPLPASLALTCTAIGAAILIGITTMALVPIVIGLGLLAAWLVTALLLGWAGIEALAALERWFENDPRFRR